MRQTGRLETTGRDRFVRRPMRGRASRFALLWCVAAIAALGCGANDEPVTDAAPPPSSAVEVAPCDSREAVETALSEAGFHPRIEPHRILDREAAYEVDVVVDLCVGRSVALPEFAPADLPVDQTRIAVFRETTLSVTWYLAGGSVTMDRLGESLREELGAADSVSERPGDAGGPGEWLSIVWNRPDRRVRLTQQGEEIRLSMVCPDLSERLLGSEDRRDGFLQPEDERGGEG